MSLKSDKGDEFSFLTMGNKLLPKFINILQTTIIFSTMPTINYIELRRKKI